MTQKNYIIAITGASGMPYAVRLLKMLIESGCGIHLCISSAGARVLREELDVKIPLRDCEGVLNAVASLLKMPYGTVKKHILYYHFSDIGARIASGSFKTNGMAIVPCSMGTLGSIAGGLSENLIERAADVCLKEGRKLILVPRETPLNSIHLENMLRLKYAGACILPAMPAFYNKPKNISDMVDFVTERIIANLTKTN
ncbi:MAG: UbiX family flavin prenyltransferase [Planctomycetes bacterium]|nr:UbiX family flavin prenyltransferase [Planctomycetota bacterium]